jgi:hypothetical protein
MPPEEHWFRRHLRAPPMVATGLSVKVVNLPSAALVSSGFAAAGGDQGVVDPGSRHVRGIVGLQPQPRVLDLPMGPAAWSRTRCSPGFPSVGTGPGRRSTARADRAPSRSARVHPVLRSAGSTGWLRARREVAGERAPGCVRRRESGFLVRTRPRRESSRSWATGNCGARAAASGSAARQNTGSPA